MGEVSGLLTFDGSNTYSRRELRIRILEFFPFPSPLMALLRCARSRIASGEVQNLSKEDIFALLSRPVPFDDGNKACIVFSPFPFF